MEIDNNGKTISDRNDRFRSEKICKELTAKYALYFAGGKEKVKEHRLKEPDKLLLLQRYEFSSKSQHTGNLPISINKEAAMPFFTAIDP